MKAVVTRVKSASVDIDGKRVAEDSGLLVLLGVAKGDGESDVQKLSAKICGLRIFSDDAGKMNLSCTEAGKGMVIVPNFTVAANCRHGRRPSFDTSERPEEAKKLFEKFCAACAETGLSVGMGVFGADMLVTSENDGPVTFVIDSTELA